MHATTQMDTLDEALITLRNRFAVGLSEYALLRILQSPPYSLFDEDALRDALTLFKTHFILFHALYRRQERWALDGTGWLDIHTMHIALKPLTEGVAALEKADPLRAYYTDLHHLTDTSKDDVENLLEDFWRQMAGDQPINAADIQAARDTLALPGDDALTRRQVKAQYRRLQHVHHPDKGGDSAASKALTQAYTVLLKVASG